MFFTITLYISLAIFGLGLIYKVSYLVSIYRWGRRNQRRFDPLKESWHSSEVSP